MNPDQVLYVRAKGRVLGPFTLAQLKTLRDRGQLRRFHEVSEDRSAWRPASTLAQLFAEERPTGPAAEAAYSLAKLDAARPADAVPIVVEAADWYYVDAGGQQAGPVPRERLLDLWHAGTISAVTLVWREGMASWEAVSATDIAPAQRPAGAGKASVSPPAASVSGADDSRAFLAFATDPVGGIPALCRSLGNGRALALGLAFCAVFDLSVVLGVYLAGANATPDTGLPGLAQAPRMDRAVAGQLGRLRPSSEATSADRMMLILKIVLVAFLPLFSLAGAVALVRLVTSGRGCLGFDVLIAGTALLPLGLLVPLAVLLGPYNVEVIVFLYLMSLCLSVLVLNSGFTRVIGLSDRGAVLAIPATLMLTAWLFKVAVTSLILS